MSLFKGRSDVYAKRWENKNKGTSGYSPVCLNQWQSGLCGKPKISCSKCENKDYAALDENTIENHLRGNIVVGVYPMLQDEICYFLAVDFDEADWQRDISVFRDVCYDRLFLSQDTMPKGGLGNLIALPLQKTVRDKFNSEFIDEHFQSYEDQWAFLSTIQRIPQSRLEEAIFGIGEGLELGVLKQNEEDSAEKPWETSKIKIELQRDDFPKRIETVRINMLFIPKAGISQKALNRLERLASFKNPMFYKQQAMRLPTYGHPRIISCADEKKEYLCLPRGCEPELVSELEELGIVIHL